MILRPQGLRPDNFTPPTRTPWGGRKIVSRYKPGLAWRGSDVVGESWEVSVEPSFPSVLLAGGLLRDHIARDPEAWLGAEVSRAYGGQSPLLIKLLDAADDLSVQVHPAHDDPALAADESGKPESWVVLEAEPGAGLYLGFREGVGRVEVEACLRDGGALDALMNFVPVQAGDAFVIGAGTVHAIGAGVTLLEPQHVSPGRRGLTYRFWDWNRRYDAQGKRDPEGSLRPLHVARSLEVTDWGGPRGEAFVEACRARPEVLSMGDVVHTRLLASPWFEAERVEGTGSLSLSMGGTMTALVCVGGRVSVDGLWLETGRSAVVPACVGEVSLEAEAAQLMVCRSRVG